MLAANAGARQAFAAGDTPYLQLWHRIALTNRGSSKKMEVWQILGRLSEAISAAAADPSLWPVFLERFAAATRSDRMILHREVVAGSRKGQFRFTYGATGTLTEEYERYYGPRNPILKSGGSVLVPGRAAVRQEACSEATFLSSEYYNDFLRPNDILQVFGSVLAQDGPSVLMISGTGSHAREPFGDEELRLLRTQIPHLQTAIMLQDRLGMAEDRLLRIETAFDSNPDAVLLVDSEAVVLAANRSARKVLEARDGLYLQQDRLRLVDRVLAQRLTGILKGIGLASRFHLDAPPGRSLRVPSASGESDWLLQIFPVEKNMAGAAVIFVSTTATSKRPAASDLADLFDLSPMQQQIALRLFDGDLPAQLGDHLRITRNTLKTHLRRMFAKLGVSRQTELMRLFSKLKPRGR